MSRSYQLPGTRSVWPIVTLLIMGAGWGLTFSLARIAAVSGAHPLGITFWEAFIAGVFLILAILWRRERVAIEPKLALFHGLTGLIGMVIPGTIFFYAASRLPAGILSLSVALVPILTTAGSALLGLENLSYTRLTGLLLGVAAILLLIGPKDSLPDPGQLPWVLLVLIAAACYAALNLVLATNAPRGTSSFSLTCGMFTSASLLMVPVLYISGSFVPFVWPWGSVEWCLIGLGLINAVAYTLYFFLVEHAGPVFSSLTGNVVTLFGVIWGIMIFGEQNSLWVWFSLVTMMGALLAVAPRDKSHEGQL